MLELPLAQPCQPAGLAQRQLVLVEEQHGDLLAQLRLGHASRLQDFIRNDQTHGSSPFCLVAPVDRFFALLRFSLGTTLACPWSSSNSALASCKSGVSNPSVNQ